MRFEKIEISNFRQYKSLILDFPKDKDTDLHVVVASNGIGKTNLLNAIDWCLYGEESHLGDESESLSICNLQALDDAKEEGQSNVEVCVKIHANEIDESIIFERSVFVSSTTSMPGVEHFQAVKTPKSGNTTILENEEASNMVDIYMPKKIKQYFFFDGEQLYNYFGKSQDTTHVKDSIHEIAQINVVTHVREHLEATIRDKQREISKLNPDTEIFQEELDDLNTQLENCVNDVEELKKSIEEAEDEIDDLTSKISGMEHVAEDDKQYNWILKEIENAEKEKKEINDQLKLFVRDYYIKLMLYDVNKRSSDYINDKESKGYLPPDINRDLLNRSIAEHKCAICNQDIDEKTTIYIKELLDKFEVSSAVSNKLMEIKNDIAYSCKSCLLYDDTKNKLFSKLREIENKINHLNEESERLYQIISTCSSVDDIQNWVEQRKHLMELRATNNKKIGSYENQILELNKKIELKTQQIENAAKGEKKSEELRSQLRFAKSACSIVSEIENEVIAEVRNKMEDETFNIFNNLIWKKNTYGRIELNKDYRLRLFHVHGDSCLGSCSAAERELLALAFTLALHKVSHHDSLLFIDTPVGRVSDDNRECFAKSLIAVSQDKQLILAFTPSEYSEEISKYFDQASSSYNRLSTKDESSTYSEKGN